MSDEQVPFRPRYSVDESSNEAYTEELRRQRVRGRRRRAYAVLTLFVGFIAVTVIFRIYYFIAGDWRIKNVSSKQFMLAKKESFGLFDDIPNNMWKQRKADSKKAVMLQNKVISKTSSMLSESGADIDERKWWVQNWLPNFSCGNKGRIGGKWICEPRRIVDLASEYSHMKGRIKKKQRGGKECLIYVSGGNDLEFGNQFLDFSMARMRELREDKMSGVDLSVCEIHVFNHFISPDLLAKTVLEQVNGIHIHPFAFKPQNKVSMGVAVGVGASATAFKTLKETVKELGHSGKSLSLLVIDCEGCEWEIYRDLLSLDLSVQQVLIQMHGTPFIANRFFTAMHNAGYAIFHREEVGGSGNIYDYSWLKLAPSYFGSTKPRLRESP